MVLTVLAVFVVVDDVKRILVTKEGTRYRLFGTVGASLPQRHVTAAGGGQIFERVHVKKAVSAELVRRNVVLLVGRPLVLVPDAVLDSETIPMVINWHTQRSTYIWTNTCLYPSILLQCFILLGMFGQRGQGI